MHACMQGASGDAASTTTPAAAAPAGDATTAAPQAAAAAASTSSSSAGSSALGGAALLTSAEPIDRLRYQAVLVFEHFDTEKAGRLTAEQVQQFLTSSARKVGVWVWTGLFV